MSGRLVSDLGASLLAQPQPAKKEGDPAELI
jgi:hypothetical protein